MNKHETLKHIYALYSEIYELSENLIEQEARKVMDELEFENTGRYWPLLEDFIEKNETAKRLGYKETLEEIGFMCDLINSNTKFERKDLDFFDFNHFDFYKEFLKSIY